MKKIIYTLVFFASMVLIMPKANALEIEVTTEDENGNYIVSKTNSNVLENPQTYDGIMNYIALAFISLIILMFAVKKVFN